MTPEEYSKKKIIRDIVDSPLFPSIIEDIRAQLADEMLKSDDEKIRISLHAQGKLLDTLHGRMMAIANEVRMLDAAA